MRTARLRSRRRTVPAERRQNRDRLAGFSRPTFPPTREVAPCSPDVFSGEPLALQRHIGIKGPHFPDGTFLMQRRDGSVDHDFQLCPRPLGPRTSDSRGRVASKRAQKVRRQNARNGNPARDQPIQPIERYTAAQTAAVERTPPQPLRLPTEKLQATQVAGYCMLSVLAANHAPQPFTD
jgi:hypothetical protein